MSPSTWSVSHSLAGNRNFKLCLFCQLIGYWPRGGLTTLGNGAQYPIPKLFRIQNSSALQSALAAQRPGRTWQRAAGRSKPRPLTLLHSMPSGQDFVGPSSRKSLHLSPGFSGGGSSGQRGGWHREQLVNADRSENSPTVRPRRKCVPPLPERGVRLAMMRQKRVPREVSTRVDSSCLITPGSPMVHEQRRRKNPRQRMPYPAAPCLWCRRSWSTPRLGAEIQG